MPFELEDFSAANGQGSSPVETTYLAQSTEEAKQQLLQSGQRAGAGLTDLPDVLGPDILGKRRKKEEKCRA